MNQPWGRDSVVIDSKNMLQENPSIIGTGDWDDDQFRNFTDENGTGIKIDDIVLVREGATPIALCKVSGKNFKDSALQAKYHNQNFRTVDVLSYYDDKAESILKKNLESYNTAYIQASGTLTICRNNNATRNFIYEWYNYTNVKKKMDKLKQLLKYKKQIVLQGPPGTGKTRLAQEIAKQFLGLNESLKNSNEINFNIIAKFLKKGEIVKSVAERTNYIIKEITGNFILVGTSGDERKATINGIISFYKNNNDWSTKGLSNVQLYEMAIAKYLYENISLLKKNQLEDSDQFKLIQFHPSYTYEDFVRGIVAESKDVNIEYKNVNKTLGLFAEKALKNYVDSKKEVSTISKEKWLDDNFNLFAEKIAEDLNNDKFFKLTDNVNIVDLEDNAFLYIGSAWKGYEHRMFFKDIKQAFLDGNSERKDLSHNVNISGSARQHATYYVLILKAFIEFLKDKPFKENGEDKIEEKSFILIIDEINRANLSSVLGELIYALEYRGKEVESMYEVDGSQKLILPPNLYIIGTMNTADRSVGHIDYAIRRRFAFVDVLPKNLETELKDDFKIDVFAKVAALFMENYDETINYSNENVVMKKSEYMTGDFDPKDVWLGHSYFIQHYEKNEIGEDIKEKPVDFRFRIRYEIKPILEEYIKDGILKESARSVINSL